ncbi:DUF2079 domain-containing protein [Glaciihabitans sp. UYNi722]|uniref:DUF2079 domain-containing protein n=1 Tax=Glaciihabitans sp. UYNi722 TaxID=3156344 RepID=UPI003397FDC2
MIPLAFVVVLTAMYSVLAIRRHVTYHSAGWDLGIFEQAIRNYAAFRPPIVALKGAGYNLLGDHFHPILVTLAPLYRLFPSPITLLIAQSVLLAVSAWPLVAWAQRSLGRRGAVAVGMIYGLSFGIGSAAGFDFHEVAFAVPLISFALCSLGLGRLRSAAAFALPLVLVKEDLGVTVVAVIGVLLFLRGARRLGIALVIVGVAATALEVGILLPLLNSAGGYSYWAKLSAHPLPTVFFSSAGEKIGTLALTFAITGFAALLSPIALAALPTLLWRFASDDPNYWGTDFHYSAILMPIVVAAMIDGLARFRQRYPRVRWAMPVVLAIALAVTVGAVPSHRLGELGSTQLWTANPQAASIEAALAMIPNGATVSASDNLVPHLTSRATVTLFGLRPLAVVNPDWIIVDPDSTRHFVVTRSAELRRLKAAEQSGYTIRFQGEGITLLRRAKP